MTSPTNLTCALTGGVRDIEVTKLAGAFMVALILVYIVQ